MSKPEFALGELPHLIGADPRRITVWMQRQGEDLHVPIGLRISERKRRFTGLEVLHFGALLRLLPPTMDGVKQSGTGLSIAALLAERAVDQLAHSEELGAPISVERLHRIHEVGLFVRSAIGRELQPGQLRTVDVIPELESIPRTYAAGLKLLERGQAPAPYRFVPIGALLISIIQALTERQRDSREAEVFRHFIQSLRDGH
ncbi:hypothetical protein [Sphingomonas segetis]|uniref:hypothetical protein n=1 Tax=Sphingomonas segetis TaxID=1104779 RepID=UPI0018AD47B7|nr:hypothetical protein [Sphingomonas segetis]